MSSIVGHLGLTGDPTARAERMLTGVADRGSFEPHIELLEGPVPGAFAHAGHRATLHSIDEPRPFRHPTGVVITADIRLDNRDSLRAELSPRGRPTGDAELALLAYLRWGGEFAEHLVGDFVVAIFDPRSGEVVLARDHMAVRPVLYATGSDWLVFGSTLVSVRDGADRAFDVYTDKLQHVLLNPLEVIEPETTFYQDIHRLPAASTMRWMAGQAPQITTYWRPERGDLRLGSDQEYQEAFLEVFDQAIACRLETTRPVAAMLSGGLDSSTVIARAQDMVQAPLRTYGFVETSPEEGSDAPHIRACQQAFRGEHFDFSEDDVAREYDLDTILADPDSPFDVEMAVLWATCRRMTESNYGVVLTGIGGDETVAIDQRTFAKELLHSGQPLAAVREMSRLDGHWTRKRIGRFLAGEYIPRSLIDRLRSPSPSTRPWFVDSLHHAGIDPASDDGRRLTASLDTLKTRPDWNTGDARVNRIAAPMLKIGIERYDRVAARQGIDIRHPMCDKRFIEFALSLPGEQLQRNSWSKYILRTAVPGLPPSVGWRPKELRSMSPASAAIQRVHGSETPVPPLAGVFGAAIESGADGATEAVVKPRETWLRHVLAQWWAHHG